MTRPRLMSTPPQFALSRLSRQLYLDFLAKARQRGFAFVRFQDFLPGAAALPSRYIALRHDVDFAPAYSLEMADLEARRRRVVHVTLAVTASSNPAGQRDHPPDTLDYDLGHEVGLTLRADLVRLNADMRKVAFG